MSTIIYSEASGVQAAELFGCSVKNMSVQMGFNSQPIVLTINLIQESDQDFTLDSTDVRSLQDVTFGDFNMIGIVKAWERTVVDADGTGVYTVRMTDCREIFLNSLMSFYASGVATSPPIPSWLYLHDPSIIVDTSLNSDGTKEMVFFQNIIDAVDGHQFSVGYADTAEADLGELSSLNMGLHPVLGKNRSLSSILTEVCRLAGYEWWVESSRKSTTDDTVVVAVKVAPRSSSLATTVTFDLDSLAALHEGKIIRRRDGYESQNVSMKGSVWGGVRRSLVQISGGNIQPFWGFDSSDTPLSSPAYYVDNDPPNSLTPTTISEMEEAINGSLDDQMDSAQLRALKNYTNDYLGKKFYFTATSGMLPRYDYAGGDQRQVPAIHPLFEADPGHPEIDEPAPASHNYLPEIIPVGWWEGSSFGFTNEILTQLCTEDGRYKAFVQLPQSQYWSRMAAQSSNIVKMGNYTYSKCSLDQSSQYVVITMPTAMSTYGLDTSGNVDISTIARLNSLTNAWIPMMDRRVHYGPWTNRNLNAMIIPSPGAIGTFLDDSLVPWKYGGRGVTHSGAMARLDEAAYDQVDMIVPDSIINTGQLEVADIPKANIGKIIGNTSNITEIFMQFNKNGVTTRYVINLYTKNLGSFEVSQRSINETQNTEQERSTEDSDDFLDIEDEEDDIDTTEDEDYSTQLEELNRELEDLEDRVDDIEEEAQGWHGGPELLKYNMEHPTGGLGVIIGRGSGPHYNVRRISYVDLDANDLTWYAFGADRWNNVRNLSEPLTSPGWLAIGTTVTVQIFSEDEFGPFVPYIEQSPQTFSPPIA